MRLAVVGVFGGSLGFELDPLQPQCQCLVVSLGYFMVQQRAETLVETQVVQVQRALLREAARPAC